MPCHECIADLQGSWGDLVFMANLCTVPLNFRIRWGRHDHNSFFAIWYSICDLDASSCLKFELLHNFPSTPYNRTNLLAA